MIVVAKEKCVGCGLCAEICHQRCITLTDECNDWIPLINHELCSTCTQCIAICPQQALSWNQITPEVYDRPRLPSAEQVDELFKQRRTIRYFHGAKLECSIVEEIVDCGSYAPTNNYELRAIAVDDKAMMAMFDAILMRATARVYALLYRRKLIFNLLRALTPAVNYKHKVKMAHGLAQGKAFPTMPAVLIFIVGDRRILLSGVSAQYALYNIILYAQAKGIGSRINAAGPVLLDKSKAVRKQLGLHRHEHILAMLEMGYPAVKFRNKVTGKTMHIQWNGGQRDESQPGIC